MQNIQFSLEVYPPKSAENVFKLWRAINVFEQLQPQFISITCGAGGTPSDHQRTFDVARTIQSGNNTKVVCHMTCAGQERSSLRAAAQRYQEAGMTRILALRGDQGGQAVSSDRDPCTQALDLIAILNQTGTFDITVAAYPEVHPRATSAAADLDVLKAKVDAGAQRVITQFFFDPEVFLQFRDQAQRAGINVPIIPGLLPILNLKRLRTFAAKCGANIPGFIDRMFADVEPASQDQRLLAMNVFSHQITRLIYEGVGFFHFYTLNELTLTHHVCRWLRCGF